MKRENIGTGAHYDKIEKIKIILSICEDILYFSVLYHLDIRPPSGINSTEWYQVLSKNSIRFMTLVGS